MSELALWIQIVIYNAILMYIWKKVSPGLHMQGLDTLSKNETGGQVCVVKIKAGIR